MKYYMADSRGTICSSSEKKSLSGKEQMEKLKKTSVFFRQCLSKTGIQTAEEYFGTAIQPNGEYDRLLYFTKAEIDSSSEILKQKIRFQNGEYQPTNAERILFQSIFEVRENGRPCWYLLYGNWIILKRNLFDNQWISIQREKPVIYQQFVMNLQKNIYRKGRNESRNSIYLISEKKDAEVLLQEAVSQEQSDKMTDNIIAFYQKNVLKETDNFSNEKTAFFYHLAKEKPEPEEVYRSFKEMKYFLHRQTGTIIFLHYEGSDLIWKGNNQALRIHVCRNSRFNVCGVFYEKEELKQQIAERKPFEKQEWYNALQPFFEEKRYIQERKMK